MRASTFSVADFQTSLDFFAGKLQFIDFLGQPDVKLVHLPGHAEGHIGLYVEQEEKPYFLLADATWHLQSLRQKQLPSMAAQLIFSNSKEYRQTFMALSDLVNHHLDVRWLPCHCSVANIQSL